MKTLISTVALAFIAAHKEVLKQTNKSEEELKSFVTEKIEVVAPYFEKHKSDNVFFITADDNVFRNTSQAWSHCQHLKDRTILKVLREDISKLLDEKPAKPKSKDKYVSASIEVLQGLCKDRGIEYKESDAELELKSLLRQHDENNMEILVTQEILDENPEMAEQGIKVGETVFVEREEVKENQATHLLTSGNAKHIIETVKTYEDVDVLKETLKVENNVGQRSTVIKALEERIAELTKEEE